MSLLPNRYDLQRIVVLNPKGGCGKTSIATNLASYYSQRGSMPTLLDCDPQGASMRWLEKRSRLRAPIHGIAAFRNPLSVTRSWQQRVPQETRQVIVDTPAALDGSQIHDLIYDASNLIIPVMPSPIDIRFAARFVAELLLVAQLDRRAVPVGIVANRTRKNTKSLRQLMRFLSSLRIPIVAVLRDSQYFVNAAGRGIGIAELPKYQGQQDLQSLMPLFSWLDQWQPPRKVAAEAARVEQAERPQGIPAH
jgi:chromosome partitioning protein